MSERGIRLHRRPGMDSDYCFAPSSYREQQSTGLLWNPQTHKAAIADSVSKRMRRMAA